MPAIAASLAGLTPLRRVPSSNGVLTRAELEAIGEDAIDALRARWPASDPVGCQQVVTQTREWFSVRNAG